ncbi:MerR family transcriptional regulator [Nocardiopsis sp. MG754419]|uniref:MerR family transcriptional regulator n=1 Tax=Nocardiopsis sp. MG754419 TaxID=2259865 RepID=UPI002010F616|nr:MerR family transcriptional regulator [Nocardiopsis sp. MG754419]
MAELSAESGLPVATIKFYLREGLLPQGVRTSATQATYGDAHLRRLRVIRALIDAGVSVARARKVLATLDEPPDEVAALLAEAHAAVAPSGEEDVPLAEIEDLAEQLGLQCWTHRPERLAEVARAMRTLREAGFALPPEVMRTYWTSMRHIAAAEIAEIPVGDPDEAVRYVVLGTALVEPLLLALRRVAEQLATVERFPPNP